MLQYRRLFSSMYLLWFCVRYTRTRSVRCKTTNDTTTPHPILNLLTDVVFCLFFFFIFSPAFTKLFHCHVIPFCCTGLPDCLLLTTFCSSTWLPPRFTCFTGVKVMVSERPLKHVMMEMPWVEMVVLKLGFCFKAVKETILNSQNRGLKANKEETNFI